MSEAQRRELALSVRQAGVEPYISRFYESEQLCDMAHRVWTVVFLIGGIAMGPQGIAAVIAFPGGA